MYNWKFDEKLILAPNKSYMEKWRSIANVEYIYSFLAYVKTL